MKRKFYQTWMGKKGYSSSKYLTEAVYDELRCMKEGTGLRVHVMIWEDEKRPTEISLQSGDGRTIGFKKYAETTILSKEDDAIEEEVKKMIKVAEEKNLIH